MIVFSSSLTSYKRNKQISTTRGYNFGNGLFLGGGTGISFNKWEMNGVNNRILIPVYADIKYSFLS